MDENLAYWSASFNEQENGSLRPSPLVPMLLPTWPSDSPLTCLAYMIVQDVTNLLLLTTWWAHNPQFRRIETWLSCTPLLPKLFLTLDFVGNSRATCLLIYPGIGHNTYSRCSEPFRTLFQTMNDCLSAWNFLSHCLTLLSMCVICSTREILISSFLGYPQMNFPYNILSL